MGEVVRILEGKSLLYEDIVSYYRKDILNEDYIVMHDIDDARMKVLTTTKPFFSSKYVVEIHIVSVNSTTLNMIRRYLKCEWIVLIFICINKDTYDDLSLLTQRGFNGYKIPESYWTKYVVRRLNCKTSINMHEVYKILGKRFELTDVIIDAINNNSGKVSVSAISKLIGKGDNMSFDLMWFNILNKDVRNKGKVFKFVEEYRYGFDFVYKNLLKHYEELIKYYKDFYNGIFNEITLREYKKNTNESSWKLTNYVDLFSRISFDEILIIGEIIECSRVRSTSDMFILIGKLYSRYDLKVV